MNSAGDAHDGASGGAVQATPSGHCHRTLAAVSPWLYVAAWSELQATMPSGGKLRRSQVRASEFLSSAALGVHCVRRSKRKRSQGVHRLCLPACLGCFVQNYTPYRRTVVHAMLVFYSYHLIAR